MGNSSQSEAHTSAFMEREIEGYARRKYKEGIEFVEKYEKLIAKAAADTINALPKDKNTAGEPVCTSHGCFTSDVTGQWDVSADGVETLVDIVAIWAIPELQEAAIERLEGFGVSRGFIESIGIGVESETEVGRFDIVTKLLGAMGLSVSPETGKKLTDTFMRIIKGISSVTTREEIEEIIEAGEATGKQIAKAQTIYEGFVNANTGSFVKRRRITYVKGGSGTATDVLGKLGYTGLTSKPFIGTSLDRGPKIVNTIDTLNPGDKLNSGDKDTGSNWKNPSPIITNAQF